MRVVVYTKNHCPKCTFTMRRFGTFGFSPIVKPESETSRIALISMGYQEYPVVTVYNGSEMVDSWSGYNEQKIDKLFDKVKR